MNDDRKLPVVRLTVEQFKAIHLRRLRARLVECARRQIVIDKLKRDCGVDDRNPDFL